MGMPHAAAYARVIIKQGNAPPQSGSRDAMGKGAARPRVPSGCSAGGCRERKRYAHWRETFTTK